jgi:hypothetical protein
MVAQGGTNYCFKGTVFCMVIVGPRRFVASVTPILNIYISFHGMTYTLNSVPVLSEYVGF